MSQESLPGRGRTRLVVPLVGRDPTEAHRAATPLELFFDLVFVVAVARASDRLHHGLLEGHVAESLVSYALVFFAIWWAWMNVTWFASAYDSDDVIYRLFVFVTMTGALILAAGIPEAFDRRDFTIATLGYVVMRLGLVTQWLRVARTDVPRRRTALRFAVGVTLCQAGWVAALALPLDRAPLAFAVLGPAELLVPVWAESASPTTWHPGHILERYGLFMIIVLGESILAASIAIATVRSVEGVTGELLIVVLGGLLIVFSLWWIYFERPQRDLRSSTRTAFVWGYAHLLVFSSVAAVGSGLAVAVDGTAGRGALGPAATGAAVAVPVAVYLLTVWALHVGRADPPLTKVTFPVGAAAVLAASFAPAPVLVIGLLLAFLVIVKVARRRRSDRDALPRPGEAAAP